MVKQTIIIEFERLMFNFLYCISNYAIQVGSRQSCCPRGLALASKILEAVYEQCSARGSYKMRKCESAKVDMYKMRK